MGNPFSLVGTVVGLVEHKVVYIMLLHVFLYLQSIYPFSM